VINIFTLLWLDSRSIHWADITWLVPLRPKSTNNTTTGFCSFSPMVLHSAIMKDETSATCTEGEIGQCKQRWKNRKQNRRSDPGLSSISCHKAFFGSGTRWRKLDLNPYMKERFDWIRGVAAVLSRETNTVSAVCDDIAIASANQNLPFPSTVTCTAHERNNWQYPCRAKV
jgi:hypothetical protein